MHIWTLNNLEKYYKRSDGNFRSGVRLKFDTDVNPEVRRACKEFVAWLRTEYYFPIRVPIYIKSTEKIKARAGELVSTTIFLPDNKLVEPYVRVSTGDYDEMYKNLGKDTALAAILGSITHELTHYFQWVNDLQLTEIGIERQANKYVDYILDEYATIREHP